jgi:hypothetical protein
VGIRYDPPSGFALLLGNQAEHNATPPFEEGDRELVDAAFSIYLDTLYRERAKTPLSLAEGDVDAADDCTTAVTHETGIQEAEIKEGLRVGGKTIWFIAVERPNEQYLDYVAYINVSWSRGYRIISTIATAAIAATATSDG